MTSKKAIFVVVYFCVLLVSAVSCTKDVFEFTTDGQITEGLPNSSDSTSLFSSVINNDEYFVVLNGRALQIGDKASWSIKSGLRHDKYVRFDDIGSPAAKFYGIPGEEYVLEWVVTRKGQVSRQEVKVKIKEPPFVIEDLTPKDFATKIRLRVYQHLRGTWTFDQPTGMVRHFEHYGTSVPPENNQAVEIQGHANTTYHIKWTYTLFDKEFVLDTVIKTGDYQQVEALRDLDLSRDHKSVVWDKNMNVVALNMDANGRAWIFDDWKNYPALEALKHIKRLNLSRSTLTTFSELFTTHYLELEELHMGSTGYKVEIPASVNKLKKLKKFSWSRLVGTQFPLGELVYPEEFGELESLEELRTSWDEGIVLPRSFGKLKNLKLITGTYRSMPVDIGNLQKLQLIDCSFHQGGLAQSISQATALKSIRMRFNEAGYSPLPSNFGNLKKLSFFSIGGNQKLGNLPESFGDLSSLDTIWMENAVIESLNQGFGRLQNLKLLIVNLTGNTLPESIGDLVNLPNMTIYGQNIKKLPSSFSRLRGLKYLRLSVGLTELPSSFGELTNIQNLDLQYNHLNQLPETFGNLKMETLDLYSNSFKEFPEPLTNLQQTRRIILDKNNIRVLPESVLKMKNSLVYLQLHQNDNIPLENLRTIALQMRSTVIYCNAFSSWQVWI